MIFDYSTSLDFLVLFSQSSINRKPVFDIFVDNICFMIIVTRCVCALYIFFFLLNRFIILTNGEILRYRNRQDRKKLVLLLFHQLNTTNPYYIIYLYHIFSLSPRKATKKKCFYREKDKNHKNSNFAIGIFFCSLLPLYFTIIIIKTRIY